MREPTIEFGAFAASIMQQFPQLGLEGTILQADADAITRLRIRGIITPRESGAAYKRLVRAVRRRLERTRLEGKYNA